MDMDISIVTSLFLSTVLLAAVIAVRTVLHGKVSARFLYALWFVAALRLLFPFSLYEMPVAYERGSYFAEGQMVIEDIPEKLFADNFTEKSWQRMDNDVKAPKREIANAGKGKKSSENNYFTAVGDSFSSEPETKEGKPNLLLLFWALVAAGVFLTFIFINIRVGYRVRECRVKMESEKYTNIYPTVYWCSEIKIPCLYGVLRPSIYLPDSVRDFDEKEQRFIVQHEKMHYLHGDFIWAMVRILLISLYWFHPLVWLGARLSKMDAEFAVDEAVVKCEDEAGCLLYGKSILHSLRAAKTDRALWRYGSAAVSSKREMIRRLKMIADNRKKSFGIMVLTAVFMVAMTACSFGGASAGNQSGDTISDGNVSGEAVSGGTVSGGTSTEAEKNETDSLTEAEHEVISNAILKEGNFMMNLDSSMAYIDVEYLNPVEAHEIMGVENIGNGKKRVYLYSYWAAYGKGSVQYPKEKHYYDERGTLEDLYIMTLEEGKKGWQVSETWRMGNREGGQFVPAPNKKDKKYRKMFREYYPEGMTEESDVMFCYMQEMAGKCNQKAIAALKDNREQGSEPKEKYKKKKLRKELENIHVFTPEYFAICFSSDEDAKWCESVRKLYNTAEFVPATDDYSLDVNNAVTLNMETVGGERAQLIMDADGYCFVGGEPYTYRIESDFDCGELYNRIRDSLAARRDKQREALNK